MTYNEYMTEQLRAWREGVRMDYEKWQYENAMPKKIAESEEGER